VTLRVLVVNWQDRENPLAGGAEIHLHEVFSRLVDRGHTVDLLCSSWPGAEPRTRLDGIDVHRTGGRLSFAVRARSYFRRHLAANRYDVLVEDLNKVPLATTRWGGPPVVVLVHHLFGTTAFREASFPVALGTWLMERRIPRLFADVPVVAVSESTRQDWIARGLSGDRVRVIPNGIDLDHYRPDPDAARFDEPTILFLGRLKRYKSVDVVVRALARLRDRGVEARFLIAGKGDDEPRIRAEVDRLRLADRVHFMGFVSEAEKLDLLRRSWLHVLPSPKEGWGITVLEAGACGTTSLASDAPGLRDSVRDGETGVLVPWGDVDAWASELERLLADADERERLGAGAIAWARRFTWEAAADGVEEVLRRVAPPTGRT
jgi:glycosyltransferase involved in cell wall biosynthesis